MPDKKRNRIGLLNESSLHRELKNIYSTGNTRKELSVDDFVADILGQDDLIIEIQTSNFSKIKRKLSALLPTHRIRVVYPLALEKYLTVYDEGLEKILYRRKSPKRQGIGDMVDELVRIIKLVVHPNFELEILMIHEEEIRRKDGEGSWRRKGVSIVDRRLCGIIEKKLLQKPADYLILIPEDCPKQFTNKQLAEIMNLPRHKTQKITYCLRHLDLIHVCGKIRNEYIYEL